MAETIDDDALNELPPVPKNPLPYRQRLRAIRAYHTGLETLRDAGGPVTQLTLAPKWLMPPVVVATSPQSAHDILGRSPQHVERTRIHHEMRRILGPNLFDLTYDPWLPRRRALQPIFTKHRVREFGGHMAQAAQTVANNWPDGTEVDLDTECRKLTLRAVGRAVLGLNLDDHSVGIAESLHVILEYITDRGLHPISVPPWLPTPARGRARAASTALHQLADHILQACRADPTRDAPLVRALIAQSGPTTGQPMSDHEIRDELLIFMLAGHDTTATTLTYALWALGHHPDLQNRVRAEALAIGDRELTPEDVPALGYTIQVLHEALRLCPPGAVIARMAARNIEVDGYRVAADTMLVVGVYALHRDPALWSEPLIFDPHRFSPQNSKSRDRWQYLPFGAGPRSCIGDHFAMLEATLALATIIRHTEIQSMDPDFPMVVPFTTVAGAPIRALVNNKSHSNAAGRHN